MKIAWIGGITRNEGLYESEAAAHGHVLEHHDGRVGGGGAQRLRTAIERADLVIAITDVNSHGAVKAARSLSRELGRSFVLVKTGGMAHFRSLMASLAAPATAA
jgi:hypothetical protein